MVVDYNIASIKIGIESMTHPSLQIRSLVVIDL